jgi:hypothetical protein
MLYFDHSLLNGLGFKKVKHFVCLGESSWR